MTTAFSRFLFIFLLPGLILPGAGQTAQKPLSQMSAAARQLIAPAPAAAVQQTAGEVGASERTDQTAAAPAPELDPPLGN